MIDYIYANGCSYVDGTGLHQLQKRPTAVHLFARQLKCDYLNNAKGGGSNQRIVRTTIDWLLENKDKWNEVLVLIGWTEFHRYEILNNRNWTQINRLDTPPEKMQKRVGSENWKSYISNFYNMWRMYNNYLDNILYLQLFLESNNIKYIFWDSIGEFFDVSTIHYRNKYKKKWDIINKNNWVTTREYQSWENYLRELEKEHDVRVGTRDKQGNLDDFHPNELGHKFWYEEIKNKAKELSYI